MPAPWSPFAARRAGAAARAAVAPGAATGGSGRGQRRGGLDGRLAGGAAAGRLAVPSRRADRDPLEPALDPSDLGRAPAGRVGAVAVGGVGPPGRSAGVGRRRAVEADPIDRAL